MSWTDVAGTLLGLALGIAFVVLIVLPMCRGESCGCTYQDPATGEVTVYDDYYMSPICLPALITLAVAGIVVYCRGDKR